MFVASHHGNDDANRPSLVHAIRPRVAVIGNGVLKGGAPRSVETLRKTTGLENIWQLHYSFLASMAVYHQPSTRTETPPVRVFMFVLLIRHATCTI